MENSKSRSSSKESIKKRKMSTSSKGSDAESESDYGENGLGSAYFNVFPDPTVEGNCITMDNKTGFMIKIGDTKGLGGEKGGRHGYGTHIPIVKSVSTREVISRQLATPDGKFCYFGKLLERLYLKSVEHTRNGKGAMDKIAPSEWYLVSLKPGQRLKHLASRLDKLRVDFGIAPFKNWGQELSSYTIYHEENREERMRYLSASKRAELINEPPKPTKVVLDNDRKTLQCEEWGAMMRNFLSESDGFDIWAANRPAPRGQTSRTPLMTSSSQFPGLSRGGSSPVLGGGGGFPVQPSIGSPRPLSTKPSIESLLGRTSTSSLPPLQTKATGGPPGTPTSKSPKTVKTPTLAETKPLVSTGTKTTGLPPQFSPKMTAKSITPIKQDLPTLGPPAPRSPKIPTTIATSLPVIPKQIGQKVQQALPMDVDSSKDVAASPIRRITKKPSTDLTMKKTSDKTPSKDGPKDKGKGDQN